MNELTSEEYTQFTDLIYKSCGINLGEKKKDLLKTRLQKVISRLGLNNYSEYYRHILNDRTGSALSELINAISTNHTYFFRENDHFKYLSEIAIPETMQRNAKTKKLRIWCAASSTGEEPYSITITVLKSIPANQWDFKLLATDISTNVLQQAATGQYTDKKLLEIPPHIVQKYFDRVAKSVKENEFRVKDEIKKHIRFRKLNLMRNVYPFKNEFDIIFCRNVMIYFDLITQQSVQSKILNYLIPGGFLFIGHSENLSGQARNRVTAIKPSLFQKI